MTNRRAGALWVAVLAVALVVGSAGKSWANHRWGCWKYADANISFYIDAPGGYQKKFRGEGITQTKSWSNFTVINLTEVNTSGTSDHVNGYSDFYGNNGWLGLAWIRGSSGCTVRWGEALINRTYMDSGYSNKNKKHVICQEIGHLFGLDHNRNKNNTCMNDQNLNAPRPNAHDRGLLANIY